jgi:hypothetical protein
VAPGIGTGHLIGMTVLAAESTYLEEYLSAYEEEHGDREGAGKVEYQPPMILNVTPPNAPTRSSQFKLQIDGSSFGFYDSSPEASVVGTFCATTGWTSDSSLSCVISHGLASPSCGEFETERACYDARCNSESAFRDPSCRVIALTVGKQRGSLVGLFTFDGPEVSRLVPSNIPSTGAINVTIQGTNFGIYADYQHKARVGNRECTQTAWVSDSSISCEVGPYTGSGYRMLIEALYDPIMDEYKLRAISDKSPALTYDRPDIIGYDPPSSPTTAGIPVTVIGSNFGTKRCGGNCKDFSDPELRIGDTMCLRTQWIADTSLFCDLGTGVGKDLIPQIEIGGQQNAAVDNAAFCFEPPKVVGFTTGAPGSQFGLKPFAINGPAAGGQDLTIFGSNFGLMDFSPYVSIGDSACR